MVGLRTLCCFSHCRTKGNKTADHLLQQTASPPRYIHYLEHPLAR